MEYRYVGLTTRGAARLQEHVNEALNPNHPRHLGDKAEWIRSLRGQITFEVLEICEDPKDLNLAEMKWIAIFKERGYDLFNATNGGAGTFGFSPIWSDETKLKISKSKMGHTVSDETRQKLSVATKRNPVSAEGQRRAAESRAKSGYTHSEETRRKISESHKKRWENLEYSGPSTETKAKLSATRKSMDIDNSKSLHVRWHEKRQIVSETCKHCQ